MMEQTPPEPRPIKPIKKSSILGLFLFLILFLLIVFASIWNIKNQKKIALQQAELQALFQQQQQFKLALSEQQQLQQVFAQQVSSLMNNNQQNQTQVFVQEISILLHIADMELRVYHAGDRTLKILQHVEQRLIQNPDKRFQPLLSAIKLDEKDLQQDNQTMTDILQAINQLQKTLKNLPVSLPKQPTMTTLVAPKSPQTISWKEKADANWQSLKKLIVIRHFDNSHPQVLDEQTNALLKQQLISLSSLLTWAVTHQDNVSFQQTLDQIKSIVEQDFIFDQDMVNSIRQQIALLQKKNVSQTSITISKTMAALSDLEVQLRKS